MILGESGTGKSASLRNLNPAQTLLIQSIKKPLPFKNNWHKSTKEISTGIVVTDKSESIIRGMKNTSAEIIVIDDFQYVLANEFMRRSDERGFDKFTEIGRHAWDILDAASKLDDRKRVYILSHTESTETGKTKIKTIGKMLDEKITLEGMVTIVLKTAIHDGNYFFTTKNNGNDTVKTPMGLFDNDMIDNDLAFVDAEIAKYYDLKE